MPAERWERLEELFAEVRALPPDEHEPFLERLATSDRELADELRSLLAADADGGAGMLDQPALGAGFHAGAAANDEPHRDRSRIGQRLGSWRLVDLVASGGMGAVYRAERDDRQFDHAVAIKLVKGSEPGEAARQRLLLERQALARLDHPGIARLIDGGTTPDGLPWFAMEYVDGQPLDVYCRTHDLDLRRRLELLLDVCAVVHYAHRHLIVHRDLKPANILVTELDGRATPKLVDFGIAKALRAPEGAGGARTTARFFSPGYASPEQVLGRAVGTASDVYSLGVVLYELLTGASPYRDTTDSRYELERMICEVDPIPPSAAAPDRARWLRGDLDNIALRALQKDADARYASVAQLAEDIRSHLEGRPVQARPPTVRYRLGKFVRRHTAASVFAVLTVLAIAAGVTATVVNAARVDRAATEAQLVLAGLTELLPIVYSYRSMSAIEIRDRIERVAERVAAVEVVDPVPMERVCKTVADVYGSLSLVTEAAPWRRRVLASQRAREGVGEAEFAETLRLAGAAEMSTGNLDRAFELLDEAAAIQVRLSGPGSPEVAQIRVRQLTIQGLRSAPVAELQRAHEAAIAAFGDDPAWRPQRIEALFHYAGLLWDRCRDYAAAEARTEEALRLVLESETANDDEKARALCRYGSWLQDRYVDRWDEAEQYFDDGLELARSTLPRGHPQIALQLQMLGLLLKDRGRYEDALPHLREGLAIRRAFFGRGSLATIDSLIALGKGYCDAGRFRDSVDVTEEALAIRRAHEPVDRRAYALDCTLLGRARIGLGEFAAAAEVLAESRTIQHALLAADHWERAKTDSLYGEALTGLGRATEARALLEASYEVICADRGPGHHRTLEALGRVVRCCEVLGDEAAAAAWLARRAEPTTRR